MLTDPQAIPNVEEYPEYYIAYKIQNMIHWTSEKVDLKEDIKDLIADRDSPLAHAVCFILKLFHRNEIFIGKDHWGSIAEFFPKFSIYLMTSAFTGNEAVHARAYSLLPEYAGLNTKDFLLDLSPELLNRIRFLETSSKETDFLKRLTAFSGLTEGCSLYSSFAVMMRPGTEGKFKNLFTILKYSVRDESLHSKMGCMLAKTYWEELGKPDRPWLKPMCEEFYKTECLIIDEMFRKGEIEDIDAPNLKKYVRNRMYKKLIELGAQPWFELQEENITPWFEIYTSGIEFFDLFNTPPTAYSKINVMIIDCTDRGIAL